VPLALLVIALFFGAGTLGFLWMSAPPSKRAPEVAAAPVEEESSLMSDFASDWFQDSPPEIPEGMDPSSELTYEVMDRIGTEIRTVGQWIERLHEAGIYEGIGAFNPPGTRPALIGLAVPEDFILPQGYVRHYQATDDGQRLEAVLMFDPDHQPLDGYNRPVDMPKDRLVPPELAPPGFPTRRIAMPGPRAPEESEF